MAPPGMAHIVGQHCSSLTKQAGLLHRAQALPLLGARALVKVALQEGHVMPVDKSGISAGTV